MIVELTVVQPGVAQLCSIAVESAMETTVRAQTVLEFLMEIHD